MSFVVDASMVAAWVLPDEQAEPTDAIMFRLEAEHARAPSLFWHEARSLLLAAERKKRLQPGEAYAFMQRLWRLPIEDAGHGSDVAIFVLAIRHGLSTYDAPIWRLPWSIRVPLPRSTRSLPPPPTTKDC